MGEYLCVVDWKWKCATARRRNCRPLVCAYSITRPFMRTLAEMLGLSAKHGCSLLAGFAANAFGCLSILKRIWCLALLSMQAETSFSERAAHDDGAAKAASRIVTMHSHTYMMYLSVIAPYSCCKHAHQCFGCRLLRCWAVHNHSL